MKKIEIFPWNESFETGIKEIDEQHRNMVNLINKLAYYFIEDKEYDIKSTVDELISYTKYHFSSEEKILEKYIDSKELILSHKKGHESFLPKINEIVKNQDPNGSSDEILIFLIKWLAFHIVDEDKKLISLNSFDTEKYINHDKESVKIFHFIWEGILKIKAIKKLKNLNRNLKDILNSNYYELSDQKKKV